MLHLVFRLEGVMAGFGDYSVGGERRAATHVPRSAVLGLLHACMGIDRRAVSSEHPAVAGFHLALAQSTGGTLVDYHTARTSEKDKVVLSQRGYQTDFRATAAAWGNEELLKEAHAALLHPAWTPYLGRRSCPLTAPLRPEVLDAASLANVLKTRANGGDRVHGDLHPAPGFPSVPEATASVSDFPAVTHGDRRAFRRRIRYEYGELP